MIKELVEALERVAIAPPWLAPLAVESVIHILKKSQPTPRDVSQAIAMCLSNNDKAAVELAVTGLTEIVTRDIGLTSTDGLELLTNALVTSGSGSASALIAGIVNTVHDNLVGCSPELLHSQPHPLLRTLMVVPDSAPEVMAMAIQKVFNCSRDPVMCAETLRIFSPFLSAMLLVDMLPVGHSLGRASTGVAASCHSQLVRIACTCPSIQVPILDFLVGHLFLYQMSDAAHRSWVLPATADLNDIMETRGPSLPVDDSTILRWTCALVAMAYDLARESFPLGAVLHSLSRLQKAWDNEPTRSCSASPLTQHVTDIGYLSLLASGSDQLHCLAMICGLLKNAQDSGAASAAISTGVYAVLQFCGLNAVAFQPNSALRIHGSLLFGLLRDSPICGHSTHHMTESRSGHGDSLLSQRAEQLLAGALLHAPAIARDPTTEETDALEWLKAFSSSMTRSQPHPEVLKSTSRWSPLLLSDTLGVEPLGVSQHAAMVCACLMGHSNLEIQRSAVQAIGAAALAVPVCSCSMLPPLLHHLKSAVMSVRSAPPATEGLSCAWSCLTLMKGFPQLATHQAPLGFILATIKTMAGTESELLRCLSMRTLVRVWIVSGKAWPALRSALLSPASDESNAARLSRAACVRDICREDGNKGIQLVLAIQEAIRDTHPGVLALGLDALCNLCESDHLDLYGAWRVVVKSQPTVPQSTVAAEKWIHLLSYGALDAGVYPEAAAALIQLLWNAADHPEQAVRQHAYHAIASYPISLLEKLEIPCDLAKYVRPLFVETDSETMKSAQVLAGKALAYEPARHKRIGGSVAFQGLRHDSVPAGSLVHRMTTVLPRRLCSKDAALAPSGAHLLCFLPLGSPIAHGTSIPQMLNGYLQTFKDVCLTGFAGASPGNWEGQHASVMMACWRRFLARWLQAARAHHTQQPKDASLQQPTSQLAFANATTYLWDSISKSWEVGDSLTRDSAALAAGSFAALLGPRHPALVEEIMKRLTDQLHASRISAQRAAAVALGALATGLHTADYGLWKYTLDTLQVLCTTDDGMVGAAVAESIGGMLGKADIYESIPGEPQSKGQALRMEGLSAAVSLFFGLLSELRPGTLDLLQSACDAAPSGLTLVIISQSMNLSVIQSEDALVAGIWHGLGLSAPALWKLGATALLFVLFRGVMSAVKGALEALDLAIEALGPYQGETNFDLGTLLGAIRALPFLFELLMRGEELTELDAQAMVSLLSILVGKTDTLCTTSWGCQVISAASESLGSVMAVLMECGAQTGQESNVADLLTAGFSSPSISVQCGAAMGCAAMLGAPVADSSVRYHRRCRQHLLAASEEILYTRTMLKALEGAALKGSDPRSARVAGLALALLCSAARKDETMSDESTEHPTSGLVEGRDLDPTSVVPVASLPANAAMRELVLFLRRGMRPSSVEEMATVTGVLCCLAHTDRLPVMNWGAICRSFMRTTGSAAAEDFEIAKTWRVQVRAACVALAVSHCHKLNLGLAELVDEWLEPQRLGSLEEPLQVELLKGLRNLLHAFPNDRAATLLTRLPSIADGSTVEQRLTLELHLWRGLSSWHMSERGSACPSALVSCLQTLHSRLPAPPSWHAGHWHVDKSVHVQLWKEALACLSQLPDNVLVQLLSVSVDKYEQKDVNIVFTKAYLAAHGRIPLRDIHDCRNFCLDAPESLAQAVPLAFASAYNTSSQATKEQMLVDVVKSIRFCSQPSAAVKLLACMAAVWSMKRAAYGEELVSAYSVHVAFTVMPYSLPKLLSDELWRACSRRVSEELLNVLLDPSGQFGSSFHKEVDRVIWSTLVAMRRHLTSDCFDTMYLHLSRIPGHTTAA